MVKLDVAGISDLERYFFEMLCAMKTLDFFEILKYTILESLFGLRNKCDCNISFFGKQFLKLIPSVKHEMNCQKCQKK